AAFAGDLKIFVGCEDGSVTFHDAREQTSWQLNGQRAHSAAITRLLMTGDGLRLLTASRDGTARLWSVPAPGPPLITCKQTSAVLSADVSIDGRVIVTGCEDGVAGVWSGESGRPLCDPLPHPKPIRDIRLDPGGKLFATACDDGFVRLYDIAG